MSPEPKYTTQQKDSKNKLLKNTEKQGQLKDTNNLQEFELSHLVLEQDRGRMGVNPDVETARVIQKDDKIIQSQVKCNKWTTGGIGAC